MSLETAALGVTERLEVAARPAEEEAARRVQTTRVIMVQGARAARETEEVVEQRLRPEATETLGWNTTVQLAQEVAVVEVLPVTTLVVRVGRMVVAEVAVEKRTQLRRLAVAGRKD